MRPASDGIDREMLLRVLNAQEAVLQKDFQPNVMGTIDRIFGKNARLSQEMAIFEDLQGNICAYVAISDISGAIPFWRLFLFMCPEYFPTDLPHQMVQAGLDLCKKNGLETVRYFAEGGTANPYEAALAQLGLGPDQVIKGLILNLEQFLHAALTRGGPPGFTVKIAPQVPDYPAFHAIDEAAWALVAGYKPTTLQQLENSHESRRALYDTAYVLGYTGEGRLAGLCWVECGPKGKRGEVHELAVHPDFQRRGLGRYLVVLGVEILRKRGCSPIQIDVLADNLPAYALYTELGFQEDPELETRKYVIRI